MSSGSSAAAPAAGPAPSAPAPAAAPSSAGSKSQQSLPFRFRDAGVFRHRPRSQHPLYATSNNSYGAKPPSQADFPLKYFPQKGEFTKRFTSMPRPTGLATAMPKHPVNDLLDMH